MLFVYSWLCSIQCVAGSFDKKSNDAIGQVAVVEVVVVVVVLAAVVVALIQCVSATCEVVNSMFCVAVDRGEPLAKWSALCFNVVFRFQEPLAKWPILF